MRPGADAGHPLTVFWHHGTPNVGAPPQPLLPVSERLGIRWVSHDRPGYGGSTPVPGRTVASATHDVAAVADSLGIEQFAVMGHSGGSAHALACGVLLPDRVVAVVAVSGLAPYSAEGHDWFAGMAEGGVAGLSAAAQGREAKERYLNGIRRSNGDGHRTDQRPEHGDDDRQRHGSQYFRRELRPCPMQV